jgi:hypothetical protein
MTGSAAPSAVSVGAGETAAGSVAPVAPRLTSVGAPAESGSVPGGGSVAAVAPRLAGAACSAALAAAAVAGAVELRFCSVEAAGALPALAAGALAVLVAGVLPVLAAGALPALAVDAPPPSGVDVGDPSVAPDAARPADVASPELGCAMAVVEPEGGTTTEDAPLDVPPRPLAVPASTLLEASIRSPMTARAATSRCAVARMASVGVSTAGAWGKDVAPAGPPLSVGPPV